MKIPVITATEEAPRSIPVTVRPEYAGMVEEALGGASRNLQNLLIQVSNEDRKIRERFEEADNLITLNSKVSEFADFNQKVDQELDTSDINPMDRQTVFMARANVKKQELIATIPNELLRKRAELALDKNIMMAGLAQGDKGRQKKNEQIDATLQQQMLEKANRGDFEGVKKDAQELVRLGIRTQDWANKQVNTFTEIGEKSIIARMLGSENIVMLKVLKTKVEAGEYTKLSPLEKSTIIVQADKEIVRLEEKAKKENDQKAVDVAYAKLKVFGENYESMFKMLRSPEWVAENNLGEGRKSELERMLHNEQNLKEQETKRIYEDTARDLFPKLGTTKPEEIDVLVKGKQLSWQVGEHFKNAIINPPEVKTDPTEYLSVLDDIRLDKDKEETTRRILASNKLSREHKIKLGGEVYKPIGDWLQEARKFLDSQLITKYGLLEGITRSAKDEAAYFKAINDLDRRLEEARKSGDPIEGRKILELAEREVLPIHQIPQAEKIIEKQREAAILGREIREKSEREKELKKKTEKYKTTEDVKRDYLEGKISRDEAAYILELKFGVKRATNR